MKNFKVHISRTKIYNTVVELEAKDSADATGQAIAMTKNEDPEGWGTPCLGDLEVVEVDEAE